MKKVVLVIVALLVLLPASAQEKVIDMDSFKDYLSEYSQAQIKKDKAKIKELEARKGNMYDRKAIVKRVRESGYKDREASAFLAAYYEYDYYRHSSKKDMLNAVICYERAINKNYDNEISQVTFYYARFLYILYIHHKWDVYNLVEELVKAGVLDKGYYSSGGHEFIQYSKSELKNLLLGKIGRLFETSGKYGYREGAYCAARMYRGVKFLPIYNSDGDIEGGSLTDILYGYGQVDWIHLGGAFQHRNEDVVKFYTTASTGGEPQWQTEFAEYLLMSMCKSWYRSWSEISGKSERPFIYKVDYYPIDYCKVFDGRKFVENEISNDDIEEQLSYWYLQAAKQDYTPAMVNLAFCIFYQLHPYDDSLHYSDMVYWLEKASTLGDTTAMYNLSVVKLVNKGRSNTHQDTKDAFYWAQHGAASGDSKCMHLLGRYYYFGIGTRIDKKEALKWFIAAAYKGSKGAAYMAGNLYSDKSVGNDMSAAVKYYESAKEVAEAYMNLSAIYAKGNGVVMDKQKAREYEKKAVWYKSYDDFHPGLCFYSQDCYTGKRTKPRLRKQDLL